MTTTRRSGLDNRYVESKLGGPAHPDHYYLIDDGSFRATVLNFVLLHGFRSAFGAKEVREEAAKKINARTIVIHTEAQQGIANQPVYIVESVAGGYDGLNPGDPARYFVSYSSFATLEEARQSTRTLDGELKEVA